MLNKDEVKGKGKKVKGAVKFDHRRMRRSYYCSAI